MVVALILGRGGSVGFPNKNVYPVMGRAMMEYVVLSALHTEEIDEIYVSTDSEEIKAIARKYGVHIIDRPDYLCTKEALHQDAMVHGYHFIKNQGKEIEFIVLMQCNAPFILPEQLKEGIRVLRANEELDSAATVSKYNMFSPTRARRIGEDGLIHSFAPLESLYDLDRINCDKDSQGDVYFTDGTFIVRPRCLEKIEEGMLPYQWMGQKSYPIMNWAGLDVDFSWQVPQVEVWLKESGFTEDKLPYERNCHV
ncbi:MAG: cytidylyltransferase [Clostridia bacterium]|jgi:CMP-N-acetylneuraminic acid synthetase|uniref:acylneuraminate cytidylyltransferase family protein n=1 Tax=Sporofaciens musculi TaxID=2681861 RepID=UPI0025A1BC33|nr:hypothetical protein [Sporofaciens musculi]MCI8362981.1 cytidylyltransferase [Clostridia bacterium]